MDLTTYQSLALRTAKPHPDPAFRMAIAGLGLAGEGAEVLAVVMDDDRKPGALIKELGDVMWYLAETCSLSGLDMGDLKPDPDTGFASSPEVALNRAACLSVETGLLADYFKKVAGHGHPVDNALVAQSLTKILTRVAAVASFPAFTTIENICELNINKLKARYPEGFTDELSLKRAED